ncbi:hypothetical protein RUM43_009436 [Polyplax serrata]|uniref:Uncharacterized protein n=1 Tax=Polyplax serrata TaxID=468196 RepID=A0AAN8RUF2_POLSC
MKKRTMEVHSKQKKLKMYEEDLCGTRSGDIHTNFVMNEFAATEMRSISTFHPFNNNVHNYLHDVWEGVCSVRVLFQEGSGVLAGARGSFPCNTSRRKMRHQSAAVQTLYLERFRVPFPLKAPEALKKLGLTYA